MVSKKSNFIGLRVTSLDLIKLDAEASVKNMSRTKFVEYCISETLSRTKREAEQSKKLTDFERLIETLKSIDKANNETFQLSKRGFIYQQKALLELFPNKRNELLAIFNGGN